jgi:HlyD family secretion protein
MWNETIIDLGDCTEFRQAFRAHAPRAVHGTAILLISLLSATLTWMTLTAANLVVTGRGRVRPISDPETGTDDFSREISSEYGGRVVEVNVDAGDETRAGAVLVRFDTTELDIQIEQLEQTIRSGKHQLEQLDRAEDLVMRRFAVAQEKARAELDEVVTELDAARQLRAVDIQLAKIALAEAQDKARRCRELAAAMSEEELGEAISRVRQAEEGLRRAQVPLNERKPDVLRQALELIRREYEVERQELHVKRNAEQVKIDAANYDLARLQHQHRQSVVRAPADCIITRADVKPGDIVTPGEIGITTARQCGFEFEVEVPSSDVAHLRPGMPVQLKLDAFDYQKYGVLPGTVRSVAPDSTLKELGQGGQAAVYNVKVTLSADELRRGDEHGKIKLGMTGKAEIVTQRENILLILVRKMGQKITLS